MLLHELPAVLVEDIIYEATRTGGLYSICRLREVNRFFELVVTKHVAYDWLCKLTLDETEQIPGPFRKRLIKLFVGDQDRGLKGFQSHLHAVSDYLVQSSPESTRQYWLNVIQECLSCCELRDGHSRPLGHSKSTPYDQSWRYHRGSDVSLAVSSTTSTIFATCFMVAVISENHQLLNRILTHGFSPATYCSYLGYPLEMACRLGLVNAVSILLGAGFRDTASDTFQNALFLAIRFNHPDIAKMLLHSPGYPGHDNISLHVTADLGVRYGNRQVFEEIISFDAHKGAFAAFKAAALNGWNDMLDRLFQMGLFHEESWESSRALGPLPIYAVKVGHLSTFQFLFERTRRRYRSPKYLLAAAAGGNVEVLELLLKENISSIYRKRAPILAAVNGHIEMLKYSINRGYHLDPKRDPESVPQAPLYCALMVAIYQRHCNIVYFLIQYLDLDVDAELFQTDGQIVTPFILAIDSGDARMMDLLIQLRDSSYEIKISSVSFKEKDRMHRYSLVCDFGRTSGIKCRWADWNYSTHQGKVDAALRMIQFHEESK